ncbi:Uncharacterized protein conserved in bacteria [Pantoea agglomerans]|uniref:Uncharacterized protein conserved in bacteria n=1 Tax=Enterobacter agglomerans TaxID=549 RepID=A0A379AAG8_ENTAG|nr:Uncharacterized protein conserved in bacteria [Pantoea agglomerans]
MTRAALPGYRKRHSQGEYVFDHAWADASQRAGIRYYPKWLGAIPFSPVSGARLLGETAAAAQLLSALPESLLQQGLSGAHINFTDAQANQLLADQPDWLSRLGCQYHWHNRGYRDFQDFLDSLMSRKRKQLRKEREQVMQSGFEFDRYLGYQLREDQWDFVYNCYANTYAVRGQRPYLTRDFFSLLAERMPQNIVVVIARLQQQPAAMAFYLRDSNALYGRYWGCLAEFDRLHFETCFYQGMDLALDEGLTRFDAGAQGEHKLVRGFEPQITPLLALSAASRPARCRGRFSGAGAGRRARLGGRSTRRLTLSTRRLIDADKTAGLMLPQPGIEAVLRQQLVMAAHLGNAAFIQHHQPIHLRDGRQAVRDGDNGFTLHQ